MSTMPKPKWIHFIDYTDHKKKTKTFLIRNKETDFALGWIKWHTGFRKYSFYPEENTVFESTCLQDIIDFIKYLTDERKIAKQTAEDDKLWKGI